MGDSGRTERFKIWVGRQTYGFGAALARLGCIFEREVVLARESGLVDHDAA